MLSAHLILNRLRINTHIDSIDLDMISSSRFLRRFIDIEVLHSWCHFLSLALLYFYHPMSLTQKSRKISLLKTRFLSLEPCTKHACMSHKPSKLTSSMVCNSEWRSSFVEDCFSGTLNRRVRRANLIILLPLWLLGWWLVKFRSFRVGDENTDLICRLMRSGSSECRRMMINICSWISFKIYLWRRNVNRMVVVRKSTRERMMQMNSLSSCSYLLVRTNSEFLFF